MSTKTDISRWEQARLTPAAEAVPDVSTGRWWVAHTKPRNEKALAQDLKTLQILHYLPLRAHTTRSPNTGRLTRSIVPVFTGYLFFNGTDEQRQSALTTNRIANTLDVPNQIQLVGELRQIQKVLSVETDLEWSAGAGIGDWARVTVGPLAGLEGVVCRRLSRWRLALNVQMLSQSISIEVPTDAIERIDPPSFAAG
ncbi:MAG: antitermination protein NusG [bacterium]|nr:antitermination protein NusG [bacterium]